MKPTVIELACGGGIQQDGIHEHFETKFALDNWQPAVETFRANYPEVDCQQGDILDDEWIEYVQNRYGSFDVLIASTPCQNFSRAATKREINAGNNLLYERPIDWMDIFRPKAAIMENVPGILSNPLFALALKQIERLGYQVQAWKLNAAKFSVPQHRTRIFVVAIREDLQMAVPPSFTHGPGLLPYRTWQDVVGNLDEDVALSEGIWGLSEERKRWLSYVPEGGNWKDIPPEILEEIERSVNWFDSTEDGKNGYLRRLCRNKPDNTITTNPARNFSMHCHPFGRDRLISAYETKRLMSLREDFVLKGNNYRDNYKLVGNGIPPLLMEAVCGSVARVLESSSS